MWYLKIKQHFIRQLSTFMVHLSVICIGINPSGIFILSWFAQALKAKANSFDVWPKCHLLFEISLALSGKMGHSSAYQGVLFFHCIESFTYYCSSKKRVLVLCMQNQDWQKVATSYLDEWMQTLLSLTKNICRNYQLTPILSWYDPCGHFWKATCQQKKLDSLNFDPLIS